MNKYSPHTTEMWGVPVGVCLMNTSVSTRLFSLAGLKAVEISHPGCYPSVFVLRGRLPQGKKELDIVLVKGVPFTGDYETARGALESG